MKERRFELAAAGLAATLLIFAGIVLWGRSSARPPKGVREVRVAWRCTSSDGGACVPATDIERCTTCHDESAHPTRDTLVDRHAGIGCGACHGGDGLATDRKAAHEGLARLGENGDVPEVQARCAACHEETRASAPSPAKAAWASFVASREKKPAPAAPAKIDTTELAPSLAAGRRLFRSLRCGACHAAADRSPIATPLAVLGLRGTETELSSALRDHGARTHVDLGLDETTATAVAMNLASIASPDESTAMVHRASAAGSSADEGKALYDHLACAACHVGGSAAGETSQAPKTAAQDDGRLRVDLAPVIKARTADWVAYFLSDPRRANPAATMPSLRLTAREAASLAAHLVGKHVEPPLAGRKDIIACKLPTETKSMTREACGAAVVAAAKCASCHAVELAPSGPSLAAFGESHDGASTKLVDHAGFHFDEETRRDLATYLLAQRAVRVRPDLRVAPRPGETVFFERGCAGCHALDDVEKTAPGPSLFGEGLRTQPQWLFDFFRAPERHGVRPPLHPEWAFRDLVPPEHVAPRMPTYALDQDETTALVRFFSERDGAPFPYAAVPRVSLSGDALTGALSDLEHKDRGACTSCHTIGTPDVVRAREEGGKLAPPLALAHQRLRPAWIEAVMVQPDVWVHGMPAFAKPPDEVDRLRDLVLLLRERTVLPPPGEEARVPALGLGDFP